ncbi:MAG: type II secretion system protein GspG [Blastocatellia bacterium]
MNVQTQPAKKSLWIFAVCVAAVVVAYAADAINVKKARELVQNIAGANLRKEQVVIKQVSAGGTGSEAVVEAQIETAFRMKKEKGEWHIAEVRLGDRQWESFELIEEAVRREKIRRTTALLKQLSDGVEAYRKERGEAPATDEIAELLDYLSPRFLNPPVRFDLWGREFEYRGGGAGYRLYSAGPDRKSGTDDDLVIENGALKSIALGH